MNRRTVQVARYHSYIALLCSQRCGWEGGLGKEKKFARNIIMVPIDSIISQQRSPAMAVTIAIGSQNKGSSVSRVNSPTSVYLEVFGFSFAGPCPPSGSIGSFFNMCR